MNRAKIIVAAAVLLCSLALAGGALAYSPAFTLNWWVVAGGGGYAEARPYSLDGVVGQGAAGLAANSPYQLCAGFLCFTTAQYYVYLPIVLKAY